MKKLFEDIPECKHSEFLKQILEHYVEKQGLGGISKSDFDALLVYLFPKFCERPFDAFYFGRIFRIKDGRVKSLYETGLNKYSGLSEEFTWIAILDKLKDAKIELESYEKGQIRFKFEDPALYKYFQKGIRDLGSTATYSSLSEIVTLTLESYGDLLDHLHHKSQADFATTELDKILPLIEKATKALVSSLGKNTIKELKSGTHKETKAGKAIAALSKLSSIGSFFVAI